ncbi:FbaB DhnA-type fructose-1,6-bisphosphate aldolase and related enzymes [Candidatus Nanopelagicaceae bacterium]
MNKRLEGMFNSKSGKCINIALDLGVFGDSSFSKGIEDLSKALPEIVKGKPDAIQLNPGGLKIYNSLKLDTDIAIALRLDVTNVYEARDIEYPWDTANIATLQDAFAKNVNVVVLNLLNLDENSRLQEQCIQNIQLIGAKCREEGIPLMIEPLVMTAKPGAGSASVGDVDKIAALVRQAVELGADLIKVDPTNPMSDFGQIVEIASGIPVLVRGGGSVPAHELLERTRAAIDTGASGVVYGRNIVQHPTPAKFIQAIRAIVHKDASVDQAMLVLEKK